MVVLDDWVPAFAEMTSKSGRHREIGMAGRDVTEELRSDVLVDIPAGQERRFGTGGKMLKPSLASVARAVAQVPRGTVMTITELRQKLAGARGAQTTCPFLTKRALMAIAGDSAAAAPYWRIVRPDGAMIDYFPGGAAAQARRLKAEAKGDASQTSAFD
jgi:alkylated DNA nucleotide flippase Atl1